MRSSRSATKRALSLDARGVEASCHVPFLAPFVGYDGQYYLCCSDWKKEVPLGSVFDASFVDVMADKLTHVRSRGTVCKTCNLDPLNRLTEVLRARDAGEVDANAVEDAIRAIDQRLRVAFDQIEELTGLSVPDPSNAQRSARRTIPVTAI